MSHDASAALAGLPAVARTLVQSAADAATDAALQSLQSLSIPAGASDAVVEQFTRHLADSLPPLAPSMLGSLSLEDASAAVHAYLRARLAAALQARAPRAAAQPQAGEGTARELQGLSEGAGGPQSGPPLPLPTPTPTPVAWAPHAHAAHSAAPLAGVPFRFGEREDEPPRRLMPRVPSPASAQRSVSPIPGVLFPRSRSGTPTRLAPAAPSAAETAAAQSHPLARGWTPPVTRVAAAPAPQRSSSAAVPLAASLFPGGPSRRGGTTAQIPEHALKHFRAASPPPDATRATPPPRCASPAAGAAAAAMARAAQAQHFVRSALAASAQSVEGNAGMGSDAGESRALDALSSVEALLRVSLSRPQTPEQARAPSPLREALQQAALNRREEAAWAAAHRSGAAEHSHSADSASSRQQPPPPKAVHGVYDPSSPPSPRARALGEFSARALRARVVSRALDTGAMAPARRQASSPQAAPVRSATRQPPSPRAHSPSGAASAVATARGKDGEAAGSCGAGAHAREDAAPQPARAPAAPTAGAVARVAAGGSSAAPRAASPVPSLYAALLSFLFDWPVTGRGCFTAAPTQPVHAHAEEDSEPNAAPATQPQPQPPVVVPPPSPAQLVPEVAAELSAFMRSLDRARGSGELSRSSRRASPSLVSRQSSASPVLSRARTLTRPVLACGSSPPRGATSAGGTPDPEVEALLATVARADRQRAIQRAASPQPQRLQGRYAAFGDVS